jgi:DNA-binding beta-propeller fold protein YncE
MNDTSLFCLLALCAGCMVTGSCRSPGEPDRGLAPGAAAIVAAGENSAFALVDLAAERVVAHLDEGWEAAGPVASSLDGATLYAKVFGDARGAELVAVDTRTFSIAWREAVSDGTRRREVDGVELWGGSALAASPDGRRLFVASAFRTGVPGVAVLDAKTRAVVGFIGPLVVTSELVTQPPSAGAAAGAILALGARTTDDRPLADSLLVIDPRTLEVLRADDVRPRSTAGPRVQLWQVLPAPDGRHVYVVASDGIFKLDLESRAVVATAALPSFGRLAIAPDGQWLYLTDPGTAFDDPGSGLLYVFGPDLQRREPIDLRSAALNGIPPVTLAAAVARDGTAVYVTAGTTSRGPLYGPQPARLLVVDPAARLVRTVIQLEDWGVGPVFVR